MPLTQALLMQSRLVMVRGQWSRNGVSKAVFDSNVFILERFHFFIAYLYVYSKRFVDIKVFIFKMVTYKS